MTFTDLLTQTRFNDPELMEDIRATNINKDLMIPLGNIKEYNPIEAYYRMRQPKISYELKQDIIWRTNAPFYALNCNGKLGVWNTYGRFKQMTIKEYNPIEAYHRMKEEYEEEEIKQIILEIYNNLISEIEDEYDRSEYNHIPYYNILSSDITIEIINEIGLKSITNQKLFMEIYDKVNNMINEDIREQLIIKKCKEEPLFLHFKNIIDNTKFSKQGEQFIKEVMKGEKTLIKINLNKQKTHYTFTYKNNEATVKTHTINARFKIIH